MSTKQQTLDAGTVRDRITIAKKFFENKRKSNIKHWNDLWASRHYDNSISAQDRISVNYVYSTIKSKLSALYYQNPKALVSPRRPVVTMNGQEIDNIQNAEKSAMVLNWQKDEYPLKKEVKKALLDWKRFGYGVMYTGWLTDFDEQKKKQRVPRKFLGISFGTKEVEDSGTEILNLKDRPDFHRISPTKIYFSPESQQDDIPYVVIERTVPYEDVRRNPEYKNTDNLPDYTYLDKELRGNSVEETPDLRRVKLWDYYDANQWSVMAEGSEEALLEKENPYKSIFGEEDALPIVILYGDEDLDNFYPLSDIQLIQNQQLELNKIRSQQMNHRKRFQRKYLYDRQKITSDEIEKLRNPDDGTLIGIDAKGEPLASAIYPIPDMDLSYPFEVEQRIKEDINVISGVLQYQLGSSGEQFGTLGQTQIAELHSQTRKDEEQEQVEDFVKKIYRRLLQLDQVYLQDAVFQRITGNEEESWTKMTREDIQGEFDLDIESGSQLKQDDDVIRKQALDAFNLFYGKPEFMPIVKKLGIAILKTFPAMREIQEKLEQLPDMPPPVPDEKPRVSISIRGDELPPDALGALAAKAVGEVGAPKESQEPFDNLEGSLEPELLEQGEPSREALVRGINQT